MSWNTGRTLDGIPERVRTFADSSKISTVTDEIRRQCMRVTMELIAQLEPMGFGERFNSTVRGLMVVGYSVPIRVMCVGLYPYEQDILPPVATALAYSPIKCHGCTPSVQILSQAMAIIAKTMRDRRSNKSKYEDPTRNVDDAGLVSKFAMLLRCSYLCSVVGVSFVNCVPIPVDNMAKRVRCASMFSEWLGKMIEIHDSFGFKMSIIAMGSFASDSVRITFSSFKGTNTKVNYVSLPNPALIAYMNIHKYPGMQPIQSTITDAEVEISMRVGVTMDISSYTEYEWKVYPRGVLEQYMKELGIKPLARALVDHTAEDLLKPFMIMSNNLFSNLGGGGIPTGYTPGPVPDTDDVRSNTGMNMGQTQNTAPNPTGSIFAQPGQNQQQDQGQGGGSFHAGTDKSFYVGKNSILAQMNDTTGKSKSQQVIVLENIINKLENILESFRSREKTVGRMCEMIETMVDRHSIDDDELADIITVVKERFPEELVQLEEATAVVAAMPALIEGDTGVIEGMIQPSAPLMRRYDGTTMRDGIYEQMMMDRNTGVAQARNPPQSMGVFSSNDPAPNTSIFAGSTMPTSQSMNMGMAASSVASSLTGGFRDSASDVFLSAIEEHGTDEMIDAVQKDLFTTTTSMEATMMEIMTTAIATYMSGSGGNQPEEESIRGMIELMDPPTDEHMIEVGTMIRDLCQDRDQLMSFFDETMMS